METLLSIDLLNELKYLYNLSDSNLVTKVFFLRYLIYFSDTTFNSSSIVDFLCRELNLPSEKEIEYCNVKVCRYYYSTDDSIESIIDDWKFRTLNHLFTDLNNNSNKIEDILITKYKKYYQNSQKELRGLKNNPNYDHSLKYLMLLQLYRDFNIPYISETRNLPAIKYLDDFDSKITIDVECQRYYSALSLSKTEKEKILENYIYEKYNISTNALLFNDIVITHRQFKLKNGIIDLLGTDRNGNIVIIELKVVKRPLDILYQFKAYTSSIKDRFNTDNVRFIAITPVLNNDIKEELQKENLEIYYFKKRNSSYSFERIY